jgi:hypothetical protein
LRAKGAESWKRTFLRVDAAHPRNWVADVNPKVRNDEVETSMTVPPDEAPEVQRPLPGRLAPDRCRQGGSDVGSRSRRYGARSPIGRVMSGCALVSPGPSTQRPRSLDQALVHFRASRIHAIWTKGHPDSFWNHLYSARLLQLEAFPSDIRDRAASCPDRRGRTTLTPGSFRLLPCSNTFTLRQPLARWKCKPISRSFVRPSPIQ